MSIHYLGYKTPNDPAFVIAIKRPASQVITILSISNCAYSNPAGVDCRTRMRPLDLRIHQTERRVFLSSHILYQGLGCF